MTDHNGTVHVAGNRLFLPVTIRPYQPDDFEVVLIMERESFAYPHRWSRAHLNQCLREFGSSIRPSLPQNELRAGWVTLETRRIRGECQ